MGNDPAYYEHFSTQIRSALDTASTGGSPTPMVRQVDGQSLPSVFAVSDLAVASIAAAACEVSGLVSDRSGAEPAEVVVDRWLASQWFAGSIVPQGWQVKPAWDSIAGDYEGADGWIKLHTNAPHHRAAALKALGVEADREKVASAVARWAIDDLESAVLEAGGAAAAMRSVEAWRAHPNGAAVGSEALISLQTKGSSDMAEPEVEVEDLSRSKPLAGLKVLDLTRVLAGPVATRLLAGWGAEVLRIDPADWSEDGVVPEVTLGKRCAHLDLKTPDGLAAVERLLSGADVMVHGYRPEALERLGLGTERRHELRPGLVDVSLDAFGWTGPWSTRRGFDSLVQLSSGIADAGMVAAGIDKPKSLPVQALDHATGYLLAAAAVRGLRHRRTTGEGVVARCSLARTATMLIDGPRGSLDESFDPPSPERMGEAIEQTSWGPALRIHAPVEIGGVPPAWELPATALGMHSPRWTE